MANQLENTSDSHHCRCFKISQSDIENCKTKLEELGFEEQPGGEQDHGQVFGLRYRLEKLLQIHWKVLPTGTIESEMEPPPEHPGAHINPTHSFPPHKMIEELLNKMNISYAVLTPIPKTCIEPEIIDPDHPLEWWEMLVLGLLGVAASFIIIKAAKG